MCGQFLLEAVLQLAHVSLFPHSFHRHNVYLLTGLTLFL
jgi:hypothetical protein